MNTATLRRASEHSGPVILAAGATSLVMALISSNYSRSEAAGPARPNPTVTVTTPAAPAGVHRSPHPSRSPTSAMPAGGQALAAGEPARVSSGAAEGRTGAGSTSSGGSGGSGSGGGGSTAPPSQPPASGSSSGAGVSVRLPLGVLPELGLDLRLGGKR